MTTTTHHALVLAYRNRLIEREEATARAIEHAHAQALAAITPVLTHLLTAYHTERMLQPQQADEQAGGTRSMLWLMQDGRLIHVLTAITTHLHAFLPVMTAAIGHLLHHAAHLGQQAALAQVPTPPAHTLQAATLAARVQAAQDAVSQRAAFFGQQVIEKVKGLLQVGIPTGMTVAALGGQLTRLLDMPRWMARTLARTLGFDVYRTVEQDTWMAALTDDGLHEWVWQAMPGCCAFCRSMDGSRHPLGEPMESHPNCRCVAALRLS